MLTLEGNLSGSGTTFHRQFLIEIDNSIFFNEGIMWRGGPQSCGSAIHLSNMFHQMPPPKSISIVPLQTFFVYYLRWLMLTFRIAIIIGMVTLLIGRWKFNLTKEFDQYFSTWKRCFLQYVNYDCFHLGCRI